MKKNLRATFLFRLSGWLVLLWLSVGCRWNLDIKSFPTCENPAAQISHQASLLAVTYSLSAFTGTADDVKWEFGDGQTSSTTATATVPHTYTASGTYTVKATLTNKCGDAATVAKSVTISNVVLPTIVTQDPTGITSSGATLRMSVTTNGNGVISRYGLCYSMTNNTPSIEAGFVIDSKTNPVVGAISSFSVTQLQPNTVYYVRAFAINSAGTGYGDTKTFTTAPQPPAVTTVGTSSTDRSTANVLFRLDNIGNPPATRYGIIYSTNATPEFGSASIIDLSNATVGVNIPVSLTNLTPNTTYYYRAYALYVENGAKPVYGTILPFKTLNDDLTTGLIVDIRFDGNASDLSGNGNNGILKNGASFTANRKGSEKTALFLDGVDDYVELADNATLRPNSISVSCWIKPTAAARTSRMHIFIKNRFEDGEQEQYSGLVREVLAVSSGTIPAISFDIKQQSNCVQKQGWQHTEQNDLVLVDQWQHVVFTYESSTMNIYHNGRLVETKTTTSSQKFIDNCPGGTLKFGAQSKDFPNYFQGAMDDVRVYNRALTDAQVTALYNQ